MVESTQKNQEETPADEIVSLITMLELRKDDPHQVAELLFELEEKATDEILIDSAIGKRL